MCCAPQTIGWFKDFAEEYLAANSGSGYTLDEVLCMRDDVVMLETHVKVCRFPHSSELSPILVVCSPF